MESKRSEPGTETASATEAGQETETGLIVYPPREGHKRPKLCFVNGADFIADEDPEQLVGRLEAFRNDPSAGGFISLRDASTGATAWLTRATVNEMLVMVVPWWIKNLAPADLEEGQRVVQRGPLVIAGEADLVELNRAARRRARRGR